METQVITRDPQTPIKGTPKLNIIAEWCRNYQPFQDVVEKEGFELQTHSHAWIWEWSIHFKGCKSFVVFQEEPDAVYGYLYVKGDEYLETPSFRIPFPETLTEQNYEKFGNIIFQMAVNCQKVTKPKNRKK